MDNLEDKCINCGHDTMWDDVTSRLYHSDTGEAACGVDSGCLSEAERFRPEEEDIYCEDYNGPFRYSGKVIASNKKGLKAWMEKEGYFPNVWHISDHGNTSLVTDLG